MFTRWQALTLFLIHYWHCARVVWWRLVRPDLIDLAQEIVGPDDSRVQTLLVCEAQHRRRNTARLAYVWHGALVDHHWQGHQDWWDKSCYLCQKEAEHYNHPPRRRAPNRRVSR